MNFHRLSRLQKHLLVVAALLTCAGMAFAGGGETLCINGTLDQGGVAILERWDLSGIPGTGLPWYYDGGPGFTIIVAPGFPQTLSCFSSIPEKDRPGLQSIFRATAAWSEVKVPVFPPQPGHGADTYPNPLPPISAFKIDADADAIVWNPSQPHDVMVQDGDNQITMWQSNNWWTFVGGPSALGVTFTYLDTSSGTTAEIVEADIALNTNAMDSSLVPFWSFVEFNDATGVWWASNPIDPNWNDPILGFADIQGVLTHEMGHLVGVEHSLIDSGSEAATTDFPTMFPFAQGTPFAETIQYTPSYPTCTWPQIPVDGILWGRSAASLQLDDKSAAGQAYPAAAYTTQTGGIRGRVLVSGSNPQEGALVVAYRVDKPEQIRASILSDKNGDYEIRGLPSGDYYVFVERVDQNWSGSSNLGRYFPREVMPNFIWLVTPSGCVSTAMMSPFEREYWDTAESFTIQEPNNAATSVAVQKGTTVTGIDFRLLTSHELLTARDPSVAIESLRGMIILPNTGGTYSNVELKVNVGTGFANRKVVLYFAYDLGTRITNGQLFELTLGGGAPGSMTSNLDAVGDHTFVYQPDPTQAFRNLFCQAAIFNAAGTQVERYTNLVNLWVTQ